MVSFDRVLTKFIKPSGRWQWTTFIIINVTIFGNLSSFPTLASLTPDHFCAIPQLQDSGFTPEQIRQIAIPLRGSKQPGNGSAVEEYDSCMQFVVRDFGNQTNISSGRRVNNTLILPEIVPCQNGWFYQRETAKFSFSFPEDFDLVCHRKYFVPMANSVYFIGSIIGRVAGGYLGDRFGRKPVMSISCGLTCILGFGCAFAPNEWVLTVIRLLSGATANAATITSIVLWSEMTNDKHRNTFGFLFGIQDSFLVPSCTILAAYLTQNWSYLHLCMTILYGISIFHPCFITESPRWLLSKGRVSEACDVIRRAMRRNGQLRRFSENTLHQLERDLREHYAAPSNKRNLSRRKSFTTEGKLVSLMTKQDLRKRILLFLFIWTVIMGTNIGLQYYSVRMKHTNPYLVAFVGSIFTIPGLIIKQFLYHFFDRKRPLTLVFLMSAVICAVGAILRGCHLQGPWDGALATIALGCILVAQNMCYAYTAESFPTAYRSYAMGLVSGMGRLGSALSSFVERLDLYIWSGLPLTIFSALSGAAACTVLLVPHRIVEEKEIHLKEEDEKEEEEEEEVEAIAVLGRSLISLGGGKEPRSEPLKERLEV